MFKYNINFATAGLVVDLLAYVNMKMRKDANHVDVIFTRIIFVCMMECLFDIITSITSTYYMLVPTPINMVLNSLVFLFVTFYALYVVFYLLVQVEMYNHKEFKFFSVLYVIAIAYMCLLVANFFMKKGPLFYFDEQGYQHGQWYMLTYVTVAFYILLSIIAVVFYRRSFKLVHRVSITLFLAVNVLGMVLQATLFPDVLLISFMSSMSLLPVMFTMETPEFRALAKALKEVDLAKQKANYANQTKSDFLTSVTSEFRNPITEIINMNELVLRDAETPSIRDYAEQINSTGRRLLALTNDIADISQVESGKIEIVNVDYKLNDILNDAYLIVCDTMNAKGIRFKLECDRSLPRALRGDATHIKQALVNLLNNSISFTERGYITVIVAGERAGDKLMLNLTVKDTGIGIKPEDIGYVFDGIRAEANSAKGDNRGIGLPLTRNLVERMGGNITFNSIYKVGSTFTILVPQNIVDDTPIGSFEVGVDKNGQSLFEVQKALYAPTASVLVVDDVIANRLLVEHILRETGIRIDMASDCAAALHKVEKYSYDAVILDHMMPEIDGIETFRRMKQGVNCVSSGTPVILCTANSIESVKYKYRAEGFAEIISKPIRNDELERLLIKLIPADKQKES